MEINELTEDDLAALAGLYKQFWGEESCLEKMQATFRKLKGNPNYIFLAAKSEMRLVGSVMGIVCEELYGECIPFMVVEDVIVDKDRRREGIGSALMRELERHAVERNCGYIIFVTEPERTVPISSMNHSDTGPMRTGDSRNACGRPTIADSRICPSDGDGESALRAANYARAAFAARLSSIRTVRGTQPWTENRLANYKAVGHVVDTVTDGVFGSDGHKRP